MITDSGLIEAVIGALKTQKIELDETGPKVYQLSLDHAPQGYRHLVAALTDSDLFLLAVGDDASKMKLIDRAADAVVNRAKVDVWSDASSIKVWSQYPFSASDLTVTLSWDGSKLGVVSREESDPTADYYQKRWELIERGDLDRLIATREAQLYPGFYKGFYTQPGPILRLAYQKALERYRGGDLPGALRYLEFGVTEYESAIGELLESPMSRLPIVAENQLRLEEQIPIANDYAFFLAESGKNDKAEPILFRVIAVVPDRAVAYLNLADVEWALGKQDVAKPYYRKYLELLGSNANQAPQRARDRSK